jgi:plasmid stabilization system protein ParE
MADIFIAAGAEQDYAEALAWYAERSHQAANGFEAEIARALEAIAADPHRYPLCDARHRFYLTQRYPFQVVYRDASYGILVVAIAHAKRRPGYWQNR